MEVPSLHPMIRNFGAPRHCPWGQLHHERLIGAGQKIKSAYPQDNQSGYPLPDTRGAADFSRGTNYIGPRPKVEIACCPRGAGQWV